MIYNKVWPMNCEAVVSRGTIIRRLVEAGKLSVYVG